MDNKVGKWWTKEEEALIVSLHQIGKTNEEICAMIGRKSRGVSERFQKIAMKMKEDGKTSEEIFKCTGVCLDPAKKSESIQESIDNLCVIMANILVELKDINKKFNN
jgi:hypothetical protein